MAFTQIVFPSAGSLSVAVVAAFILILQAWFSTKGAEFRWCRWAAAVSFSAILYALGIFLEYNAPEGPVNRFGGLLEWTAVIFLVHTLYGLVFSRLNVPSRRYHLAAGGLHVFILILLWTTNIFVSDHFVVRRFLFLEKPFVEADLGPLGLMFVLYALFASINAIRLWIMKEKQREIRSRAYVWGASFWILLGAHDAVAALGLPSVQYVMEYGFLGFSASLLYGMFSDYVRTSDALGQANVNLREEMETRKRTEEALGKGELKFRLITETIDDVFWMSTRGVGKMIFISPAYERIWGRSIESLYQSPRSFLEAIHPDDLNTLLGVIDTYHKKGKHYECEYRIIRSDGEVRWIHERGYPVTDSLDGTQFMTGVCTDITARRKEEERVRSYVRSLEFLNATAMELVAFPEGETIYSFIGLKLMDLLDDSIVVINFYEKHTDTLRVRAIAGLGEKSDQVLGLLGRNPVGMSFKITDEKGRADLLRGRLVDGPPGLYELSFGAIPVEACKAIEGLLGLRKTYGCGFVYGGELLGGAIILSRKEAPFVDRNTLEAFLSQVSMALQRNTAEQALRRSEQEIRMIADNVPGLVSYIDREGRHRFVNRRYKEWFGLSPTEVIGKHFTEVLGREAGERIRCHVEEALSGERVSFESSLPYAHGGERWVSVEYVPDTDEQGMARGFFGLITDITERKRLEDKLREREEKFRSIYDNSMDAIFFTAPDGRIFSANPAACKMTGYTEREMVECGREAITDPTDPRLPTVLEERRKTARYRGEAFHRRKDGSTFPAEVTSAIFRDKGGEERAVVIVRDITERKETEESLRETQGFLISILDNAPALIYVNGMDNRYRLVNKAWEKFVAKSQEEVLGRTIEEVFSAHTAREFMASNRKVVETAAPVVAEESAIRPKGNLVFHTVKFPVKDADGQIEAVCGISIDISERKRVEEALAKSEALYREAQRVAHIGHWDLDVSTGVPKWSEEIFRIFDLDPRQGAPSFKAHRQIIHPDDWNLLNDAVTKASTEGIPFDVEFRLPGPDESIRWMKARGQPVRDNEGRIVRVFGTAQDITERRLAEEALRESEQKYRLVSENIPVVLYSALPDEHSTDLFISGRIERLTGYRSEDYLKTPGLWEKTVHPEDMGRVWQAIKRHRRDKIDLDVEYRIVAKNGAVKWVRDTASPVLTGDGEILRVDGFMEDITEKKKVEEELRQSQVQLLQAQKMEMLGTLVAGVAHEINNPVSLILFNAHLLRKIWSDLQPVLEDRAAVEPQRKYGGLPYDFLKKDLDSLLEDMEFAGNRIAIIVKSLKDFARGSDVKAKKPMSLNEAVENAFRLAETTIRKSGVKLQFDLGADLPPMIGNKQSIEQIVLNILINGVQAIKHEQGIIEVRTAYDKPRGGLTLNISDNGEGISPDQSSRIFDPFYTSRQGEGGTGLGLAVTHSLVREHKGQITFESQVGKGTTFKVLFPLRPEEVRFRLLVVDDEAPVRKVLRKAFTKGSRFEVRTAKSGTEALLTMGTYRPDVLILDLMMPGMDGLELCHNLRKSPELSAMAVVIITGYANDRRLEEIRKLGYTCIYPKPLNVKEFVKEVERLVEGKE